MIFTHSWLTLLDNTKWFHNLSALIKAALVIVDTISVHERPVLVHCSDGWDRTPQVVALAQLMLDPYYRTIDGFKVLVEREWLQFGHKFTDRCRSTTLNIDLNERCPVFLQWLDCVHQLIKQFPSDFEFNVYFLVCSLFMLFFGWTCYKDFSFRSNWFITHIRASLVLLRAIIFKNESTKSCTKTPFHCGRTWSSRGTTLPIICTFRNQRFVNCLVYLL